MGLALYEVDGNVATITMNRVDRMKTKIEDQLVQVKQLSAEALEHEKVKAENERRAKELEEARQLQLSMLPKKLPSLPHLDIAPYTKPATAVGGDHHHFQAVHAADAGDDARRGCLVIVLAVSSQRREFEERAARVEQGIDAFPREQLAARRMFGAGRFTATQCDGFQTRIQGIALFQHGNAVGGEFLGTGIDGAG